LIPAQMFRDHFQLAYVVRDLDAGMARFRDRFGVAKWSVLDVQARSGPQSPLRSIATAYVNDVMIELMEAMPDRNSIYDTWLAPEQALRLHHLGFLVPTKDEWDDTCETLKANGIDIAYQGGGPGFMSFLYADTVAELGHYYEMIHLEEGGQKMFAGIPRN
jgi:catechol 2,3-dioxygenase-like lactoylglutathione lyase family enzyme